MTFEYGITEQPHPLARNEVFDRVVITPNVRGGTVVTYWLRATNLEGPYNFYLEWAEHPNVPSGEWNEVAGPSQDNILTDPEQRRFSKLPHSVYRVRLESGSGVYYSDINPVTGEWNRHDWHIAREIIRREYLQLQRYTGTRGIYLARKQWGELCAACTDYNTELVNKAHCPICYGTSFVGGYHTPSVLWVGEDTNQVRSQREDGIGVTNNQTQIARVVAFPFLTANDVWVSETTGERWVVQAKQKLAVLRGKPLVWGVELRLEQPGSIIYDIPLEAAASSSST